MMQFRFQCVAKGYYLARNHSLQYSTPNSGGIAIVLKPRDSENEHGDEALCVASATYEVPTSIAAMFDLLAQGRLPEGRSSASLRHGNDPYVDNQGNLKHGYVPWNMLPEPLEETLENVQADLLGAVRQALNLLRWRYGDHESPHDPFQTFTLQWSDDGETWRYLTRRIFGELRDSSYHKVPDALSKFVHDAMSQGSLSPLAHDLLREARQNARTNPRSAILLAVAAMEVGFKHCVATLVPDAAYLVEKLQTPPLPDLLKNYLPLLPAKLTIDGQVIPPPKRIRDVIAKGIETRNQIAHRPTGGRKVSEGLRREEVDSLLEAVGDVLWLLDFYCGHEWAFNFVSSEMMATMMNG